MGHRCRYKKTARTNFVVCIKHLELIQRPAARLVTGFRHLQADFIFLAYVYVSLCPLLSPKLNWLPSQTSFFIRYSFPCRQLQEKIGTGADRFGPHLPSNISFVLNNRPHKHPHSLPLDPSTMASFILSYTHTYLVSLGLLSPILYLHKSQPVNAGFNSNYWLLRQRRVISFSLHKSSV